MSKKKCHYEVEYFDPADPEGERWKKWKCKTRQKAREVQSDLRVAWKERGSRHFPIKKVCTPKRRGR